MPPEKKRNYRQMLAGDPAALRQYYMQTQEQREIQKQERSLKLQNDRAAQNAVAEALEQMTTCVQRHKRDTELGRERYEELRPYRRRGHRTIAEKRQQFHLKMMRENRFYKLAYERDPSIKDRPIQQQKEMLRVHYMTLFTMKVRIIELRYGRIDLNGGVVGELAQVRETYKQISLRVGRPLSTVAAIIRRFEKNEYILTRGALEENARTPGSSRPRRWRR